MERRQLECFLAIADAGSMAEAARRLRVSQPALSQTMRTLERELGALLFHRLPRGVTLTAAGESLIAPARQVIRDFGTASELVNSVRGLRSGHLDLVTLPGLVNHPLAPWLGRFRKHWPDVAVRIDLVETPVAIAEAVRTGASEVGLTIDRRSADDLQAIEIGVQELVAVLTPATAAALTEAGVDPSGVTLEELMDVGLITGRPGTLIRDLAEQSARERGLDWHPVIEIDRREAVHPLVRAGAGVAVLPAASGQGASGLTTLPLRPRLRRAVHLVHRVGPISPAAAAFSGLVSAVLPER